MRFNKHHTHHTTIIITHATRTYKYDYVPDP